MDDNRIIARVNNRSEPQIGPEAGPGSQAPMPKFNPTQESQGNRLRRLRSFCFAAQTGSISKAAERAMLSQPSVSLQIQALELEFKAKLFQRRGPKIQLTPDGQALYKLAWPLVEAVDSLPAAFHAGRDGLESGRVNIAAGESTILYILPETIKRYSEAHPGIELRLQNVTGRDGLKMLRSDAVDFAVGSMIEVPEDISYLPTFRYDPMLITARDHPLAAKPKVTIKDVAQYPLILPPQHLTTWRVVDYVFHKYGLNYRVALEAGGWEVIKRYVDARPRHLHRHQRLPERQGGPGRDPVQSLLSPAHLRRRPAQGQARLPPGHAVHRDAHLPGEGEALGRPSQPPTSPESSR